jgi:hypothetical protein
VKPREPKNREVAKVCMKYRLNSISPPSKDTTHTNPAVNKINASNASKSLIEYTVLTGITFDNTVSSILSFCSGMKTGDNRNIPAQANNCWQIMAAYAAGQFRRSVTTNKSIINKNTEQTAGNKKILMFFLQTSI